MEVLKQRLASLRSEESELSDRIAALDDLIRECRSSNDELQNQIFELSSKEKLVLFKLQSDNKRLASTEATISNHERLLSVSTPKESGKRCIDDYSKEEDLEAELAEKLKEVRLIDTQFDEMAIHLKHVESEKVKKMSRADALESKVAQLEAENSDLLEAQKKAESGVFPDDTIDQLEENVLSLQQQLDAVTAAYEASERETMCLDRSIANCKSELNKQREANESLRKEIDSILGELESI